MKELVLTNLIYFIFSMKWLWIIAIILIWRIVNSAINIKRQSISIDRQKLTSDIEFDEQKIISHIDYVINECIDQYILLNVTPNSIYYINSKIEKELIEYVTDNVSDRFSPIIMDKLSMMYNPSYVPIFLGEHIYLVITRYVLEFNINQSPEIAAASINNSNKDQRQELAE